MTKGIIYILKWKDFNYNVKSRVSDVIKEQSFCDVTLVSDDHKPFLAHRYVLSSFSPVLKDILLNNPHSHPLIYLRGINHKDFDSILQFIYFGKAWVDHNNMNKFAEAAKNLQIKKLAENIRMGNSSGHRDYAESYENIPYDDNHKVENETATRADRSIELKEKMNQFTDLKMAIDATFSSILNEIQLSNLNFTLQITPFAAYITLKKSVLTDQNGIKAVPAPPVIFLLQQVHQTIAELQEENNRLKINCDAAEKFNQKLVHENAILVEAIDVSNNKVAACNATTDTLRSKLEAAEEKNLEISSLKSSFEVSLKETKKSHKQEIANANSTIKSMEKGKKDQEKVIYNLKRNLESTRDILKNLKSDNSSLKISKAKLETEKRKLEKLIDQRDFKIAKLNKNYTDLNKNYVKPNDSSASSSPPVKSVAIPSPILFHLTQSTPL